MKRVVIILGTVLILSVVFVFLARGMRETNTTINPSALQVTATFYPLAEFARKVGGEHVAIETITPSGTEPHDFEPTPRDIVKIRTSDVFLVNGAGLDPWATDVAHDVEDEGVHALVMSDHIEQIASINEQDDHADEDEHENEEDDHGHQDSSGQDPHFWLDPIRVQEMVDMIAAAFAEADPEHAADYQANADQYKKELDELDAAFKTGLASCETKEFVVSHAAFSYLADRYNLDMHSIAGISPEDEPSPRRLAELTEFVREEGVEIILFETLVSPKIAETLARETDAKTGVLNPLEGLTAAEAAAGRDYIYVMRENLSMLRSALRCS